MSGLWTFSVQVRSWFEKIESDPAPTQQRVAFREMRKEIPSLEYFGKTKTDK